MGEVKRDTNVHATGSDNGAFDVDERLLLYDCAYTDGYLVSWIWMPWINLGQNVLA